MGAFKGWGGGGTRGCSEDREGIWKRGAYWQGWDAKYGGGRVMLRQIGGCGMLWDLLNSYNVTNIHL